MTDYLFLKLSEMALRAIKAPKGTGCVMTEGYYGNKYHYSKLPIAERDVPYNIDETIYTFPAGTVRTELANNDIYVFESNGDQYGVKLEIL